MTIDSEGRVAVSGAGYVRLLVDRDRDGRADAVLPFADGPRTGAQGLFFDGTDLLCVGDQGLLRYQDRDGDGRADGPPQVLLTLRTGGEHHAHAVRRGPDGWLYLIAGNDAQVDARYVKGGVSPVSKPSAGVLLRISPDGSKQQIVCDGFRNAYDFDFDPQGNIYVYDSDDERDVSFPWYRPTRVFQVMTGATAGWISRAWKLPDQAFDLMPVVASLGRGSPTGVVCYRHRVFPDKYRGALFVADWTFGRVIVIRPHYREGGYWSSETEEFLTGQGSFGFAPTDLAVGPDGALYVSVGGRGTRGGVFRVTWNGGDDATTLTERDSTSAPGRSQTEGAQRSSPPASSAQDQVALQSPRSDLRGTRQPRQAAVATTGPGKERSAAGQLPDGVSQANTNSDELPLRLLAEVLDVPDPLSSWSRAVWEPRARWLGPDVLRRAVFDQRLSVAWRVRAIEILTECFDGLSPSQHLKLIGAPVELRRRAAWSWGIHGRATYDVSEEVTSAYLQDDDASVVRGLLDALALNPHCNALLAMPSVRATLLAAVGHAARDVRQQWMHFLAESKPDLLTPLLEYWNDVTILGRIVLAGAYSRRPTATSTVCDDLIGRVCQCITRNSSPEQIGDATRVLIRLLGDTGPVAGRPAVLDGYAPCLPERISDRARGSLIEWFAKVYPTGDAMVDHELERLAAVIEYPADTLPRHLLELCNETSSPIDDIHRLVVLARLPGSWSEEDMSRLARIWWDIEQKVSHLALPQDRHWPLRWQELLSVYQARNARFIQHLLRQPEFGRPEHAYCLVFVPEVARAEVLERFWNFVDAHPDVSWPAEWIAAAVETGVPEDRQRLRQRLAEGQDLAAILTALSKQPQEEERPWFYRGLQSNDLGSIEASVQALERLPPTNDIQQAAALISALRKLDGDRYTWQLRERVARLLDHWAPEGFGFVYGQEGYRPQPEVLQGWQEWLKTKAPELADSLFGSSLDTQELDRKLAEVPWQRGLAERGRHVAQRKGCIQCHASRNALGPDLAGVTRRFALRDLFIAIAFPSANVSPRYQMRIVETTDGRLFQGAVIYESVDGLTLSTPQLQTVRLESREIVRQETSPLSLMPAGLIDDLTCQDLADLYAWLQTIK